MYVSTYNSEILKEYIGLLKTMQHSTNLSLREEETYSSLIDNDEEWFKKLAQRIGKKKATKMMNTDTRVDGLSLILPVLGLTRDKIRIALKSTKQGTPTFMDQEITRKLVDHLFKLERAARREEEAIGSIYE